MRMISRDDIKWQWQRQRDRLHLGYSNTANSDCDDANYNDNKQGNYNEIDKYRCEGNGDAEIIFVTSSACVNYHHSGKISLCECVSGLIEVILNHVLPINNV